MDDNFLTNEAIEVILKLIEESKFDFLQLEWGDFKLTVNKKGNIPAQTIGELSMSSASVETPSPIKGPDTKEATAPNPQVAEVTDEEEVEEGFVPIKAPTVGVFYVAPEPGAKPFVNIGSKVDEDTAVGTIEVMKVFSSVMAGVKGIIKKRVAENAKLVEYGQTLFLVEPEKGDK